MNELAYNELKRFPSLNRDWSHVVALVERDFRDLFSFKVELPEIGELYQNTELILERRLDKPRRRQLEEDLKRFSDQDDKMRERIQECVEAIWESLIQIESVYGRAPSWPHCSSRANELELPGEFKLELERQTGFRMCSGRKDEILYAESYSTVYSDLIWSGPAVGPSSDSEHNTRSLCQRTWHTL